MGAKGKPSGLLARVLAEQPRSGIACFTADERRTIDEALDAIAAGESACSITKLARHISEEFKKPIGRSALTEYARRRRANAKGK